MARKLEQTLTALRIAHDVKQYPEAGHSFLNNPGTWWFKALRIVHIGYDETAAEDARRRIATFFASISTVRLGRHRASLIS